MSFAALPPSLRADLQRPGYHFLPKADWQNDPNGPVFWNGVRCAEHFDFQAHVCARSQMYHLFAQFNPNAAIWGDMTWLHAVSPDLVSWKILPNAIAPTPNSYGEWARSLHFAAPLVPTPIPHSSSSTPLLLRGSVDRFLRPILLDARVSIAVRCVQNRCRRRVQRLDHSDGQRQLAADGILHWWAPFVQNSGRFKAQREQDSALLLPR